MYDTSSVERNKYDTSIHVSNTLSGFNIIIVDNVILSKATKSKRYFLVSFNVKRSIDYSFNII